MRRRDRTDVHHGRHLPCWSELEPARSWMTRAGRPVLVREHEPGAPWGCSCLVRCPWVVAAARVLTQTFTAVVGAPETTASEVMRKGPLSLGPAS